MAHTTDRYKAAPFGDADTWRISDTRTGEAIAIVKGQEKLRRRLDQLNGEEVLRQGPIAHGA